MSQPLSLIEQLSQSTVRIECDFPDGTQGTGTGFFYSLSRNGSRQTPVIVTNKHVIEGSTKGRFIVTQKRPDGLPDYGNNHIFEFQDFSDMWEPHPDQTVDLCAMLVGSELNRAKLDGRSFYYTSLDGTLIPTDAEIDDFSGMEEITMVGYPNGIWDETNNLPVFRRGVLATQYKRNWNGKLEFLIDAACFPGSSGSPVFLCDMNGYVTRKEIRIGASRIKFLGVLYAGPQHTVEGEIQIVNVPIHTKQISVAGMPINLGIVIKAERVREFESVFKLVDVRNPTG